AHPRSRPGRPSPQIDLTAPIRAAPTGSVYNYAIMKRAAFLVAILIWPARAFAWNPYGHMVVAASAWEQIGNHAVKKKIAALLKLNPLYDDWIKGVPAAKQDRAAFVMAATWPDIIKDKAMHYVEDGANGGNIPDNVPASSDNTKGYEDRLLHKYWHFI